MMQHILKLFSSFRAHDAARDWAIITSAIGVVLALVLWGVVPVYLPKSEVVIESPAAPSVPVTDSDFNKIIGIYSTRLAQFQSGSFPFLKLRDPVVPTK